MPSLQLSVPGQLTTSVISRGAGLAEAELAQPLPDVVERLVADPAQDEVLLHGAAGVAAGELAHDRGQAAELLRGEVAAGDLHLDRRRSPPGAGPGRCPRRSARTRCGRRWARRRAAGAGGRVGLLVVVEAQALDQLGVEVALVDPVALELLVDLLAEGVDADLVDQDLDPGAGAVLAQPLLAVEDPQHRLGDLQVVAVVGLDELVEGRGDAGHDRGAAADPDLEALDRRRLSRARKPMSWMPVIARSLVGAGEGGLELARHQLGRRVADEVADVGAGVGGRVEDLVGGDAGPGVAGDVADRVAAALARGEAGLGDLAQQQLACRAAARGGSGCSGGS